MNEPEDEIEIIEPEFAPWDGRRVPVVLVGGYLGAGKTTLINEMLARTDVPIAVLVNDVGTINVDAALLARQAEDSIDLSGGCVCCSLKNGFLAAYDQLRQRPQPPELVVVELSGIADPRPAAGLSNTPGFRLDSVVVLVDLERATDHLDGRSGVAATFRAQIHAADLILLTKRDLVSAETEREVRQRLLTIAPDTPQLDAGSAHTAAGLVGLAARRPVEDLGTAPSLFDVHRTAVIEIPGTLRRSELDRLVDSLGPEVVRAKGIVQVETGDVLVVQRVGRRTTIEPLPMAESQPTTDLVVISVDEP